MKEQLENALIIFIKNPIKGKVKTRLAKTLGDDAALEIYLQMCDFTRQTALQLQDMAFYVFYSDAVEFGDDWPNEHFEKRLQSGGDLGARMQYAFESVLKKHRHVCIIGSDCPALTTNILQAAFKKLKHADFVVGPSSDGGYYLLGITAGRGLHLDFLFQNMTWSTENVLPETLKRLSNKQKSVAFLPELPDVDEAQDWFQFLEKQSLQTAISIFYEHNHHRQRH